MSDYLIQLEEPLQHGEEIITEVVFQTPRVKHLLEFDKETGEYAGFLRFLSALAGLPPKVLGQMTLKDMQQAKALFADFLPEAEKSKGANSEEL